MIFFDRRKRVIVATEIVQIFGMLKSELELKGTRLDDFDLIIGATARTHNLIVVSTNEKHA